MSACRWHVSQIFLSIPSVFAYLPEYSDPAAYVRTSERGRGTGTRLMKHLETLTEKPILIGTWAVSFYREHGYRQVNPEAKDQLLKRFWNIPGRRAAGGDFGRAGGSQLGPDASGLAVTMLCCV